MYEIPWDMNYVFSAAVTIAILILELIPERKGMTLLVVNCTDMETFQRICEITKKYTKNYDIKSRIITKQGVDAVIEVRCNEESRLLTEILEQKGMIRASLVDHSGEIRV